MSAREDQMANSRNPPKRRENDNENLGLMAIGSAGGWDVAIDETTSGAPRWFVQIEGPSVYLSFEVQSPSVIDKLVEFLTDSTKAGKGSPELSAPSDGKLVIGKSKDEPVTFVKDDEFPDRYFLVVETKRKLVVRVTLAKTDLKSLVSALRQAKDDLEEDDSDSPMPTAKRNQPLRK
jgi:hypothetical protein